MYSTFNMTVYAHVSYSKELRTTIHAVKPNHELEYNIGADFCVEDPMSTSFHSTITCLLVRDAIPPPDFRWNVTLNGTELTSNSEYVNDTLFLTGPIGLDNTSTLEVICEVSNDFGSDSANTSISLCSKP